MAAVTQPISPAGRRPFGVLRDARLRAAESMKNKQNGTIFRPFTTCTDIANRFLIQALPPSRLNAVMMTRVFLIPRTWTP